MMRRWHVKLKGIEVKYGKIVIDYDSGLATFEISNDLINWQVFCNYGSAEEAEHIISDFVASTITNENYLIPWDWIKEV